MTSRVAGRRVRLAGALLGAVLASGSAAAGEHVRYRGEVRQETSASGTGESALNPDGRVLSTDEVAGRLRLNGELAFHLERWSLKSRATVDVTAARPHRSDASRVDGDFGLRDLYLNGSLGPFQVSAGRKILKWSNGYAWSPAGILDPVRDPADPQDRLGRTRGRDLVQLDYYHGAHTFSVVASAPGRFWRGRFPSEGILAARHHVVWKSLELATSGGWRPHGTSVGAVTLNYAVGDHVAFHGEASFTRGTDALYPRSTQPGTETTLFGADFMAPLRADDRALCARWLLGLNYTFGNGLNLIAEYYHTDEGLSPAEWDRFATQAAYSRALFEAGSFPPVAGGRSLPELNLLQAMQILQRGGARRNYAFLRAARTQWRGRLEATALTIVGLDDRSFVVVPEVTFTPVPWLGAYVRGSAFGGGRTTEYGLVPAGSTVGVGALLSF
jgi:hypothetical protein